MTSFGNPVGVTTPNPYTGQQTMATPSYYGAVGNPLDTLTGFLGKPGGYFNNDISNYLKNPGAYLAQLMSSIPGGAGGQAPNLGPVQGILGGLGLSLNPDLGHAPAWQSTPNLESMASMQGTPLTLTEVANRHGGLQGSALSGADEVSNWMLGNWLPQYAKAAFQTNLAHSGAASGVPGETAMGGGPNGGMASVFGAKTLANNILPQVLNVKQQALAPFMQALGTLQAQDVGNAQFMSQANNTFTNQMSQLEYLNNVHKLMEQQQQAGALTQQNLGYQNASNLAFQNAYLNNISRFGGGLPELASATIGGAFRPMTLTDSGALSQGRGGTNYLGNTGGNAGAGQFDPGIDTMTKDRVAFDAWANQNAHSNSAGYSYDPYKPSTGFGSAANDNN